MTEPYVRPAVIPADGTPRKLDAGWFVAYLVRAPDLAMAGVQARIRAKINKLRTLDVVQAVHQMPDDEPGELWLVELMIEAPKDRTLGL